MYTYFAVSQQGESHLKANNKPCEDASGCFPGTFLYEGESYETVFAAVADGHGGDKYFRSRYGSALAVEAADDTVKRAVANAAEGKTAFFDPEAQNRGEIIDRYLTDIEQSIIGNWQEKVITHAAQNPWTEEEKEFCTKHTIRLPEKGEPDRLYNVYGTTLLAAFVSEKFWFVLQIGDGASVIIPQNLKARIAVAPDEEQGFGITKSLCNTDAITSFRHNYGWDSLLAATVASDGIEDSFSKEQLIAFNVGNLLKHFVEDPVKAEEALRVFMPKLSKNGSQDDVSIAGILNSGAAKPALPYIEVLMEHKQEIEKLGKEVTRLQNQLVNDAYKAQQEKEAALKLAHLGRLTAVGGA